MHPHFRVIPFFLVEFVMLVSVDTRLWFCMGSEFTSLTLTREPVLRIHLHEMIAIYSWLVTGQQWWSMVLPKRKSHLNPWWASSGSPEWIRRSYALVTSIELPALCGHENAQQHKRHKILFPLSFSTVIHSWVSPWFLFYIGKNINVKGMNCRRVQSWLGAVSSQARNFHLCLSASLILSWSGPQSASESVCESYNSNKARGDSK